MAARNRGVTRESDPVPVQKDVHKRGTPPTVSLVSGYSDLRAPRIRTFGT